MQVRYVYMCMCVYVYFTCFWVVPIYIDDICICGGDCRICVLCILTCISLVFEWCYKLVLLIYIYMFIYDICICDGECRNTALRLVW